MTRHHTISSVLAFILLASFGATLSLAAKQPPIENQISDLSIRIPLSFIPNVGQFDREVRFLSRIDGGNIFFQPASLTYVLPIIPDKVDDQKLLPVKALPPRPAPPTISQDFINANDASVTGTREASGVYNFFVGSDSSQWVSNVTAFESINYLDLYPGVSIRYEGVNENLKSTYIISPGADPNVVRWAYKGARNVFVDTSSGELVVEIPKLTIEGYIQPIERLVESAPIAWQEDPSGRKTMVLVNYFIDRNGAIGFTVDNYDHSLTLFIDPTLEFSSYISGTTQEDIESVVTDTAGNSYIVGEGLDLGLPNPIRPRAGAFDAYLLKISPAGTLVFYTFIGGSNDELGNSVILDSNGNIFVAGKSATADFPFPNGSNTLQRNVAGTNGYPDIFISKFNSSGALQASTFLGGVNNEAAEDLDIDSNNNVYVVGWTDSPTFVTASSVGQNWPSANSFQSTNTNTTSDEAFIARVNNNLTGLTYGSFLGGTNRDEAYEIRVYNQNNVYIVGETRSSNFDIKNSITGQSTLRGGSDGFVALFNPQASTSSSSLVRSTYYGGNDFDAVYAVDVDSSGSVYFTGSTSSSSLFPLVATGSNTQVYDTTLSSTDAFVAKLNSSGSILYSTYIGGSSYDVGKAIRIDVNNVAYIVGETFSTNFPSDGLFQTTNKGGYDVFMVGMHPSGFNLMFSSYFGGADWETVFAMAISKKSMPSFRPTTSPSGPTPTPQSIIGVNHVVGVTQSTNFPTLAQLQGDNIGRDGFVMKYAPYPSPTTSLYLATVSGTTLYNLGCDRGTRDGARFGTQRSLVLLDFGQPSSSGSVYGTILFDNFATFASTSQIANAVQEFGRGYYNCIQAVDPTSTLTIGIGTNNKEPGTTAAHGQQWATMAKSVQDWFVANGFSSRVSAVGASDMEVEYSAPVTTKAWIDAYHSVANRPVLYNFGDASGCATPGTGANQTCNHTQQYTGPKWTLDDLWYISTGVGSARALPQIYAQGGNNARQWYEVALYGSINKGSRVLFVGALTQYKACKDKRPTSYTSNVCINTDQIAEEGWRYLWSEIQKDTRTQQVFGVYLVFSTDIRWDLLLEEY